MFEFVTVLIIIRLFDGHNHLLVGLSIHRALVEITH